MGLMLPDWNANSQLVTKHIILSHSFQNAEEWLRKTFAHHRNRLPTLNYYLFMFS